MRAFLLKALAVLEDGGLKDDDARINPNGGAIALGASSWSKWHKNYSNCCY